MSETPVSPENAVNKAINTSVKFAFGAEQPRGSVRAARDRLEQKTRGPKEAFSELAGSLALRLASKGILSGRVSGEVAGKAMATIWKSAEERAARHLEDEAAQGNTKLVWRTLNEIDPFNVPIRNLSARPGEPSTKNVRGSVGLTPGSSAFFHEADLYGKFPDNPHDTEQIIICGQPCSKGLVRNVLDGKGIFRPMWQVNEVTIPLAVEMNGQLQVHIVTVTKEQLPALYVRLHERENIQIIGIGGESDSGITRRNSPDEDSFFAWTRGQGPIFRLAEAEANKAARPNDLSEQIRLVNERAGKFSASKGMKGLFIVADGMGGEDFGEHASQEAVQTVSEELAKTADWTPLSSAEIQQKIKEAVEKANKLLFDKKTQEGKDLGTTFAMTTVINGGLYVAHVGDSRVYLYEKSTGNISRLTEDHSLVGSLVRTGQITEKESYTHPQRSVIYRCLGDRSNVEVDVSGPRVVSGKVKILVCCDGVWEMVRDPQLKNILSQPKPSRDIVQNLVSAANANGGEDNITAVVAELNIG